MTFILATTSIMAVSIFLIYKLTNYFGFRLKYKSLILCAIMAFLVNISAILLSPYLTRAHYLRLIFLVIAAAAIVTIYNERLLYHEAQAAGGIAVAAPPDGEEHAPSGARRLLQRLGRIAKGGGHPADGAEALAVAADGPALDSGIEVAGLRRLDTDVMEPLEKTLIMPAVQTEAAAAAAIPKPKKAPVPKARPAKDAAKAETPKPEKALPTRAAKPAAPAAPLKAKPALAAKQAMPAAKAEPAAAPKAPIAPVPSRPVRAARATLPTAEKARLVAAIAKIGSLDELIDYAYAQKGSGNYETAVLAYQNALERYRDDSYAPFLAIELGNIHKERAAYDEAIRTYTEALSIPAIADDDATYQEFDKNLSYLRTVKYILSRHNALATPFPKIPAAYIREIEAEFQRRTQTESSSAASDHT